MPDQPRMADDYAPRQVLAARRVIVDVMQVLAAYKDCLVLVGGWVPDLLISDAEEPHVGSIDVDLALDVERLNEGRYAEMLSLLLATKRYSLGEKPFQFVTTVDLGDGDAEVRVEIEFLAPKDVKTERNHPKLMGGFRVLKADGCQAAFRFPLTVKYPGKMISGAKNTVSLQVASVPDFLIMKAFALGGRDKPKDAYDICYCLDHWPEGVAEIAKSWSARMDDDSDVVRAVALLREKFETLDSYGPMQVVEFHNDPDETTRAQQARRAFELVKRLLSVLGP